MWCYALIIPVYFVVFGFSTVKARCLNNTECDIKRGFTCQNHICISKTYGEKCESDIECFHFDLICAKSSQSCICKRGHLWDIETRRCYENRIIEKNNYSINTRVTQDLMKDVLIPTGTLATLITITWLCLSFCSCGKKCSWFFVKRPCPEHSINVRRVEEGTGNTRIVASYRTVTPNNNSAFPLCLVLPVAPPSYQDALKHKILQSSYPINCPPLAQHQI